MIKSRIDIRIVPNPNTRIYELSITISASFYAERFRRPFCQDESTDAKKVGKTAIHLLKKIFALPGVEEVFVERESFSVVKKEDSDWKDIEPSIIKTLKKAFGKEVEEVAVSRSPFFHTGSIDELFGPDFGNW